MDPLVDALAVLPRASDRLAVAFSGGMDSSVLLHAAVAAHGPTSRLSIRQAMEFLPNLRQAAASIGQTLA